MAQRIVKLCLIRGYTEAYHQLSADDQAKLRTQVGEVLDGLGVKMVGPSYNCRWSNDKYASFFLLEYPNIEAAIADTAGVEKAGLFRYIVSETILAIPEVSADTTT
jgi:hypothetical protein